MTIHTSRLDPPANRSQPEFAYELSHIETQVCVGATIRAATYVQGLYNQAGSTGAEDTRLADPHSWRGLPDGTALFSLGGGRMVRYQPPADLPDTQRTVTGGEQAEHLAILAPWRTGPLQPLSSLAALVADLRCESAAIRLGVADSPAPTPLLTRIARSIVGWVTRRASHGEDSSV